MSKIVKYKTKAEQTAEKHREFFLNLPPSKFPCLNSIHKGCPIFSTTFYYSNGVFKDNRTITVNCRVPVTDPLLTGDHPVFQITPAEALPFATFNTN